MLGYHPLVAVRSDTGEVLHSRMRSGSSQRGGEAQVAETTITAGRRDDKLHGDDDAPAKLRLIVRRTSLLGAQAELWPNWRYHCFVTDRHNLDTKAADTYHRAHTTVELAIRDLKESAHRARQLTVAATIRNRLLTVPGRLVNHSGRHRLRLPPPLVVRKPFGPSVRPTARTRFPLFCPVTVLSVQTDHSRVPAVVYPSRSTS